jgi:hypothetical protein
MNLSNNLGMEQCLTTKSAKNKNNNNNNNDDINLLTRDEYEESILGLLMDKHVKVYLSPPKI